MAAFAAEVYLRQLGERLLDAPEPQPPGHWSALRDAAVALVCAEAIDADRAWWVIDDYATARQLRSGRAGFVHFGPPRGRREGARLPPRQFRLIDQEIPVAGHQVLVRDLAITADGGRLQYRRHLPAPGSPQMARLARRPGGFPGMFPWLVAATVPEIVDSLGNRPAVQLGEGGRDGQGHMDGELELVGTIASEATWLEIDGTRVDLRGPGVPWEVGLEPLDAVGALERCLWRHLAVASRGSGVTRDLEPMIEALIAAGALQECSRFLADLRAVSTRMPRRPLHQRRTIRAPASGLIEPWGSLLDREGADDGPEWTRVLGAVAPVCDGVQFAVNAMTSDASGFEIEHEVAPHVIGVGALDELPVSWWARDDLANHYLGIPTLWGGCRDDRS